MSVKTNLKELLMWVWAVWKQSEVPLFFFMWFVVVVSFSLELIVKNYSDIPHSDLEMTFLNTLVLSAIFSGVILLLFSEAFGKWGCILIMAGLAYVVLWGVHFGAVPVAASPASEVSQTPTYYNRSFDREYRYKDNGPIEVFDLPGENVTCYELYAAISCVRK